MRHGRLATAAASLLASLVLVSPALADPPFKQIMSSGPLPTVSIGNESSCQVTHAGDAQAEIFPPATTPADCGTFVWNGATLFAPNFAQHGAGNSTATSSIGTYTAWTPVSQTDVAGNGSQGGPFTVTTVYDAGGAGLRLTQVDSYITGTEYYRTDVTIQNTGGAASAGILYRAGDCFLQNNDNGFGFVEAANNGPGCSQNANNNPAGRIEQWVPLTGGGAYMEDRYATVWSTIGAHQPFPSTCQCTTALDNGAGLSWPYNLAPGARATFSHLTVFSPTGVTGGQQTQPQQQPPTTTTNRPPNVTGSQALPLPSNRRCLSRRAFPIKVRQFAGLSYSFAYVAVNGRTVPVYVYSQRRIRVTRIGAVYLNTRRFRAFVDLRGLGRGTYRVRVSAVTTSGRLLAATRTYHTCSSRLSGTIPLL